MCNAPSNPATLDFVPPNLPWPVTDARERPEIFAQPPGDHIRWRRLQPEPCNPSQTCHQHKLRNLHLDVARTASTFNFSFACEVCPSSDQTDSFAPKQPFRISGPKVQTSPQDSPTCAGAPPIKSIQQSSLEKSRHLCQPYDNKKNLSRQSSPIHVSHYNLWSRCKTWQIFYSFFFIGDLYG